MHRLVAATTIAACVLVSMAVAAQGDAESVLPHIATPAVAVRDAGADGGAGEARIAQKQQPQGKPGAVAAGAGNDACRWARDNECDDPDIGTGACALGTDASDCRAMRTGENDSCRWANDGECDEPRLGTGACVQGTDRTDCGDLVALRNQTDACVTAFNSVCEEPGSGDGSCEARTDRSDCRGRARPLSILDHFFGRDDRVRVPVDQRPWSFMGVLQMDNGDSCTATLIARDVVVTAAHCIHNERGLDARGSFQSASGGHSARIIAYLVDRRFELRRFAGGADVDGMDWALLRLDQPLGDRLGFAGIQDLTAQGQERAAAADLMQAGYSWDTGGHLSGNLRCHIVRVNPDHTFAHECDTTRGDSGSAFVVRNGEGFDVIGVDSRFRPNPRGPFLYIAVSAAAFAPRVPDFVVGRSGFRVGSAPGGSRKGGG